MANPVAPPRTTDRTAAGLWEQVDEKTGTSQCWFKITERDGVYEGSIVRVFPAPSAATPSHDPGETHDAAFLGRTLIRGMRRNGHSYSGGTITDPRNGSVYSARMELSGDGQRLEVRGYLGISLFGRSQMWNRLPQDALGADRPASASPP